MSQTSPENPQDDKNVKELSGDIFEQDLVGLVRDAAMSTPENNYEAPSPNHQPRTPTSSNISHPEPLRISKYSAQTDELRKTKAQVLIYQSAFSELVTKLTELSHINISELVYPTNGRQMEPMDAVETIVTVLTNIVKDAEQQRSNNNNNQENAITRASYESLLHKYEEAEGAVNLLSEQLIQISNEQNAKLSVHVKNEEELREEIQRLSEQVMLKETKLREAEQNLMEQKNDFEKKIEEHSSMESRIDALTEEKVKLVEMLENVKAKRKDKELELKSTSIAATKLVSSLR